LGKAVPAFTFTVSKHAVLKEEINYILFANLKRTASKNCDPMKTASITLIIETDKHEYL
jgi:hypothetical protein